MNDNRVTAVERFLGVRFRASRLKPNAVTDLDWLTALGMVAAGRCAFVALRGALRQDRSSLEDAMKAAVDSPAGRARERMESHEQGDQSHRPACTGIPRPADVPDMPRPEVPAHRKEPEPVGKACPKCHGTGKQPLPIRAPNTSPP